MVESGLVVDLKDDIAIVRFSRKASCKNCNLCGFKKNDTHIDLRVKNTKNANINDIAIIEMRDSAVLIASIIVYIFPLILAGIGLVIGGLFNHTAYELAFCLGFLVIGFVAVFLIDKKFKYTRRFAPIMVGIEKKCKGE